MINLPSNIMCHRKIGMPVTAKIKKSLFANIYHYFSRKELKGSYKDLMEGHLGHSGHQLLIR